MSYGPRTGRRLATVLTAIGLATMVAAGAVFAGTPVTQGYRDHSYGGGAFRPSADKPQSKLWYTDEGGGVRQWWAGMFYFTTSPPRSENRIFKLTSNKAGWGVQPTVVDTRDTTHADYLWDEASNTLYVASAAPIPNTVPTVATDDGIKVFKYTYAGGAYTAVAGFPVVIPNTASVPNVSGGGAPTVTIALDSTGDLWTTWTKDGEVRYSKSDDGGAVWSAPVQLPVQVGNPVSQSVSDELNDTAAVIAFGTGAADTVGIMWNDENDLPEPALDTNGYWFAHIAAGDDPTVEANWTLEDLPPIASTTTNSADNHINMKSTSDGKLYMVGKTSADTINCATNQNRALVPFYDRTTGGTWTAHLAGTVGDCNTRPQMVISEELDVAYLFMTSPNGGGTVYLKSAPLSGPDAFVFRGAADTTLQRGIPFIQSATETLIDDPTSTKQNVTDASEIVVNANNLVSSTSSNVKVFLHNFMNIPASDATAPSGTVSINSGAPSTSSQAVSVAVPATDTGGSGVSLVRLSNNSDMSNSTMYVYRSPIPWTLTAGLGTKTVYVEWRDAAGNWTATASDSIEVTTDVTAPTAPSVVSHTIFGSGRFGIPVRITWTAGSDNSGGSGVKNYQVERQVNGGAWTVVIPETTALGASFDLPNSAINYRFRVSTRDNADNLSAPRLGTTFKTISYSESSTAMKYTGTWSLSSSPVYIGGKARVSVRANSTNTLAFSGNRVGWYSRLGPTSGSARVYIDGKLSKTVSLYSSVTVDRKLVYTKSWGPVGNHTIRIVVVGTSGRPRVTVDQIFVLR